MSSLSPILGFDTCFPWCYLRSSARNSSGLFDDVSHGHALVQDSQFAVGVGCWGVQWRYNQIYWRWCWRTNFDKRLIKIFQEEVEKTCGGVHKDSSILQCPVNISHHWPNVPKEKGVRKRYPNVLSINFKVEHQPAAIGVASHFFGFDIFLHCVLPVLLVAL